MLHRACAVAALVAVFVGWSSAVAQNAEPAPEKKRYDQWKLVEVTIRDARDLLALNQVGENMACTPRPGPQTYVIPPDALAVLDDLTLPYRVVNPNIQQSIDAETAQMEQARAERGVGFFATYRTPDEIDAYIDTLITLRPDLASSVTVGTTHQLRTIRGIRITGPDVPGEPARPVIIINAGQHAREWIAPASAMWAMDQLIRNHGTNPEITDLVNKVVWIIIPSLNRDGYQYSIDTERLWRKNRRNNGDGTFGVDLNRNWSYQYGGASTSSSGSSDVYRGTGPFSEPESTALRNFILATPNVKGLIDLHSFSQLILGPWGYSQSVLPPRELELRSTGDAMEAAIDSTHGVNYQQGLGVDALIYEASGTLPDWSFATTNAVSWTYELRDTGSFGFVLPADQIIPTGQEAFNGLKELARAVQLKLKVTVPQPLSSGAFGQSVDIGAQITELNGYTLAAGSAKLFWRVGSSGNFTEVSMTGAVPNFVGTLPGTIPCGATVEYYVEANANDGTPARFPTDAPASRLSLAVLDISEALNDTLESDAPGWLTSSPSDTATTGRWILVNPNGTSAQPEDDRTPGAGSMCFVTGQGAVGGAVGSADVDNGFTTLSTPIFDLSGGGAGGGATISYWRWYSNAGGNDAFVVEISNNAGANWSTVEVVGPTGPGTSGGWIQKSFDPAAILPLTANMRVRFIARDDSPGQVVEAAIDDFIARSITLCATPACPGDADGDGLVGLSDIAAVINGWGSSGPSGDLDNDGSVGLSDVAVVVNNWGAACP